MKPKITRTVKVAADVKLTPDHLQAALDQLWEQDVPGDAGLSLLVTGSRFTATASWDVLDAPAVPDEAEAQDAEATGLPLDSWKPGPGVRDSAFGVIPVDPPGMAALRRAVTSLDPWAPVNVRADGRPEF